MLYGLIQKLPRFAAKPGGADGGLLERARNASFILLGLTAAIGIGLVAFIAHLGWPNIIDGPIPGPPAAHLAAKNAAIAAAAPSSREGAGLGAQKLPGGGALLPGTRGALVKHHPPRGTARPRLSGSKALSVPAARGKGSGPSSGQGPAAAPSTPSTPSPTPSSHPGQAPPGSGPSTDTTSAHLTGGHGGGRGGSGGEFGGSNDSQGSHGPLVADRSQHQGQGGADAGDSSTPHGAASQSNGKGQGSTSGPATQHGEANPGWGHDHGSTNGPGTQHGQAGSGWGQDHGSANGPGTQHGQAGSGWGQDHSPGHFGR